MHIVDIICRKKELSSISREFVAVLVKQYQDSHLAEKDVVKLVRKDLRLVYGMYQGVQPRPAAVYEHVFRMLPSAGSILDLGCGYAPLDYAAAYPQYHYRFYDVNEDAITRIRLMLNTPSLQGDATTANVLTLTSLQADICFLFNVIESFEYLQPDSSGKLLKDISVNIFIISFPKRVLSGKEHIRKKGRIWFRRLLGMLGYGYQVVDIGDEIFFIIQKPHKDTA